LRPPLPVPATREERYDDRDHTLIRERPGIVGRPATCHLTIRFLL